MLGRKTIWTILCIIIFLGYGLHHGDHQVLANEGALSIVPEEDTEANGDGVVEINDDDDDLTSVGESLSKEKFLPTNEWQTIKPGQSIPAGLHVRLNLETGLKEAKLNNDNKRASAYWPVEDIHDQTGKKTLSKDALKKALKDFKTSEIDDFDEARAAEVRKSFRSYEELREDFQKMNMDIKTDAEIITDLLDKLRQEEQTTDEILRILTDLEYYLHQIDNAVLFRDLEGLPVLLKMINSSTYIDIQNTAALTLGAALQSNPKVQIGTMEAGGIQILLRVLSTNQSRDLRKTIVFAISTLIRHFPFAQRRFLELGGLSSFSQLFQSSTHGAVCIKAVALLNELLIEQDFVEKNIDEKNENDVKKRDQYREVHLREAMIEQGWCDMITSLLKLPGHDVREKVLDAMTTLSKECRQPFQNVYSQLETLKGEYILLAEEEKLDSEKYYTHILEKIEQLLKQLYSKDEL